MARAAYCHTCERTVYLEEQDTAVCPVCSTPLLYEIDPAEGDQTEDTVPQ